MIPGMNSGAQGQDPIKSNMSMFNPTDLAAAKASGEYNSQMTVRQVFEKLGVDVDGPATQLMELAKKQTQNANPLTKMRNIAASGQNSGPAPAPMPGAGGAPPPGTTPPPAGGGGLGALLKGR